MIEALACGVPVIATSAPDNLARHLVARSARGTLCEPTPEAFADAISRALAPPGPELTTTDEWVRDFDWESVTGRVAGVVLA